MTVATPAQYLAATLAASKVIQADIKKDIPVMFQGQIPQDKLQAFTVEIARAVADAVVAVS